MQLVEGISGRTAVVTGAAQGIGRNIADLLVANGAKTAYLDLDEPNSFTESSSQKFFQCNVTEFQSIENAFTDIESVFGSVELLVNNAGIFKITPIAETSIELWNQMLAVNLTGAFLCSKRALPGMKKKQYGRIVSIGSSAGKTGGSKDTAAYGVSKAGVHALAKAIATEYAPYGVTSNALAPALINTDMVKGIADLADRIPVGRLGEAKDVARAALFLLSESSSFITGEVMDVNGGFLID
ncbi:MAG: SDR family NAD(P)-dependent oxidoreductase [Acidimicrobiales bacterium]|nr:SDR family NAD(P)-dependent oxidoreductase [Acidimicrobiales bacterium]